MQLDIKDIVNGSLNGKIVWICDFRFLDMAQKPIRHIKPTECIIKDNTGLKKTIYYSKSHFVVLKNGKETKTIIAPFDNTGYRSRSGNPVEVFDTQMECEVTYKVLCEENLKKLDMWFNDEISPRYYAMKQDITKYL